MVQAHPIFSSVFIKLIPISYQHGQQKETRSQRQGRNCSNTTATGDQQTILRILLNTAAELINGVFLRPLIRPLVQRSPEKSRDI